LTGIWCSWNVKVEVILRIIGATGSISKAVEYICGKHSSVELQKIKASESANSAHLGKVFINFAWIFQKLPCVEPQEQGLTLVQGQIA
jgi:hypothetical protein